MYVVDASVVIKWFLPEAYKEAADVLLRGFLSQQLQLMAPDFIVAEIGNVLWKRSIRKDISVAQANESYQYFLTLALPLRASSTIAPRALGLGIQENHPIYDTLYVALAENQGCELVTADQKLLNKLGGKFPFIRWIGTF